jgi:hypothetical protein
MKPICTICMQMYMCTGNVCKSKYVNGNMHLKCPDNKYIKLLRGVPLEKEDR